MTTKKIPEEDDDRQRRRLVGVSIEDLIDRAQERVISSYGGFGVGDIKHVYGLVFSIPDMTEEGKCNEINSPDEEGGCGDTGGSCICGKKKGHEGSCECKLCGEGW